MKIETIHDIMILVFYKYILFEFFVFMNIQ